MMRSVGVDSGSESITEAIDTICKSISALQSMRRTLRCDDSEGSGTEVLESYHRQTKVKTGQTLIDIAELVGSLVKLTHSCRNNNDAAVRVVSVECRTAISLIETCLQNSSPSTAEAHRQILLRILQKFPESFSQSMKMLQANTALCREAGKVVRKSAARLYRITAVVAAGFCFVGILYSCYLRSAHTLGGVILSEEAVGSTHTLDTGIWLPPMPFSLSSSAKNFISLSSFTLSGVAIGCAYGFTKVFPLLAALNETAQKFDQAIRDFQHVQDLINEHIHIVGDSLSNFEALPSHVWASVSKHDCLQQSINKLMEICNEFVKEAEEDV